MRTENRMEAEEIELLDRENALLELEKIVGRVRTMADMSYISEIGEAWEYLDIWAAGGNAEAKGLLVALKSALGRMGPSLEIYLLGKREAPNILAGGRGFSRVRTPGQVEGPAVEKLVELDQVPKSEAAATGLSLLRSMKR